LAYGATLSPACQSGNNSNPLRAPRDAPFEVIFDLRNISFVPVMQQPLEPAAPFDAFRKIVLAEPLLLEQLRATPDVPSFIALVREMARVHGFQFSVEDVQAALRASQQAWIERWI